MGHHKMLHRRRKKQRHKKQLAKAAKRADKLRSKGAPAGGAGTTP